MTGEYVLRTDGGARGNPGPGGAGFVLEAPGGEVVRSGGRYLGEVTNNVAEYQALVWGLKTAIDHGVARVHIRADSELVVHQVTGRYKVRNEGLKPLHREACELLGRFEVADVRHVRREENEAADALANEAMDGRCTVGDGVEDAGPAALF